MRRPRLPAEDIAPDAYLSPPGNETVLLARLCEWLPSGVVAYASGADDASLAAWRAGTPIPAAERERLMLFEQTLRRIARAGRRRSWLCEWATSAPWAYGGEPGRRVPIVTLRQGAAGSGAEIAEDAGRYLAWRAAGQELRQAPPLFPVKAAPGRPA